MKLFSLFLKNEQGGGLIEYVLVIALIALASVTAMTLLGGNLTTAFNNISGNL